jgi:hypothetical protein
MIKVIECKALVVQQSFKIVNIIYNIDSTLHNSFTQRIFLLFGFTFVYFHLKIPSLQN